MTYRLLAIAASAMAGACLPAYTPPRTDQPHAVVHIERRYEKVAGVELLEAADVDEQTALRRSGDAARAKAPGTDSILVHPRGSRIVVSSRFFHIEPRLAYDAYEEPRTVYENQAYSCGAGQTCTRPVARMVYDRTSRETWKQVEVSDGSCHAELSFEPKDRGVYTLEYTYRAPSVCSLTCSEEVAASTGRPARQPCRLLARPPVD
ncbi:MAG: hypothetical protein QM756_30870 [Polyangiaceae bacterium]